MSVLGGGVHPTQTLTDLLTLREEKGRLDNLTIGFCGDLKNGRTVHSLIKAMVCFPNNKFILVSTSELALPVYVKDILEAAGMEYKEVTDLEEVIGELDVLYMTRIQKERFASEEEYQTQSGNYILDTRKLSMGKPMVRLSSLPFSSLSVSRSVSVCVGWRCPPSPALITGQSAVSAAAFTEPAVG